MKVLYLPLKKKWYNMIESGEKTEEYRNTTPYWIKRLCNKVSTSGYEIKRLDSVKFSYGYTKRNMIFKIRDITLGNGKVEWGAAKDKEVFIIKLGEKITII